MSGDFLFFQVLAKFTLISTFSRHVFPLSFLPALFELSLPKRKLKEERRKKKMRPIKMESEDPIETLAPSDTLSAAPANVINSLPDTPSTPLPNIKEE